MKFLPALLLIFLFACTPTISVFEIPEESRLLPGLYEHDINNLAIDFESSTYIVYYTSLIGYGEWRYIAGFPNTIRVRDTLCGNTAYGEYHILFTKTGIHLTGNDMNCRGRLDRWAGNLTAITRDTGNRYGKSLR